MRGYYSLYGCCWMNWIAFSLFKCLNIVIVLFEIDINPQIQTHLFLHYPFFYHFVRIGWINLHLIEANVAIT